MFELDADTEIDTHELGAMTVEELERLWRKQRLRRAAAGVALLGQLPRSDAGADGFAPHQLGQLRPRHLRHHDGNDLAPARAGADRRHDDCQHHAADRAAQGGNEMSDLEMLTPPPPEPTVDDEQKKAVFDEAVIWLHENFALIATGEQRGTGRIAPIKTRTATSTVIAAFRTMMLPYRIEVVGPRGGLTKKISPVDIWLTLPERVEVAGFRTQPDKPWPTFTEDGATYINLYLRPELPEDGDATIGREFLAALLPDDRERKWFEQALSHKLAFPWIPGPSIVMIAQDDYGTGRGLLFKLIIKMFGWQYVKQMEFADVIGRDGQATYTDWLADSIIVLVDETSSDEDHRYTIRQKAYERLKDLVDTSRKRRRIKGKWAIIYDVECGAWFIFASNHNTPLAIADKDRRLTFLRNGLVQAPEFYIKLAAWMEDPANVGAFRRHLESVDREGFNPYAALPTTAKDVAAEDGRSILDEAVAFAFEVLPGEIVMREQIVAAIRALRAKQGWPLRAEWEALVMLEVKRKGRRIGVKDGKNWKWSLPQAGPRRVAAYARTEAERQKWSAADAALALAELQKNETEIAKMQKAGGWQHPFDVVNQEEA